MATESVTANEVDANANCGVPWIGDLLVNTDEACDFKRLSQAADNVLATLLWGMHGIGGLLWHANTYGDEPVDRQMTAKVGYLLALLAEQAERIGDIGANAEYCAAKKGAAA